MALALAGGHHSRDLRVSGSYYYRFLSFFWLHKEFPVLFIQAFCVFRAFGFNLFFCGEV